MGGLCSISSGVEICRLSGAISSQHRKAESVLCALDKIDGGLPSKTHHKWDVLSYLKATSCCGAHQKHFLFSLCVMCCQAEVGPQRLALEFFARCQPGPSQQGQQKLHCKGNSIPVSLPLEEVHCLWAQLVVSLQVGSEQGETRQPGAGQVRDFREAAMGLLCVLAAALERQK